jgi:hypothetical protein
MTDEDALAAIPIPVLEPHEVDAVFGLLVPLIRIDVGNAEDKEKIAELQAAVDERSARRAKYIAAFDAFGFEGTDPAKWDRVRKAIGDDIFRKAYYVAFPDRYGPPEAILSGARNKGAHQPSVVSLTDEAGSASRSDQPTPKIGEAILSYLRSVGSRGVQVGEIKKHLLDVHDIQTHEKTPGMTLYRLSKEGLVHRDGRNWFATNTAETSSLFSMADRSNEGETTKTEFDL